MQGTEFDQELSFGLELMTEARWDEAQTVLQSRLNRATAGGFKRLNLFLLSIAYASGGQGELANSTWAEAQKAPLGQYTPRYLDLQLPPNDLRQSVLLDLERAWWNFNGWNEPQTPQAGAAEGVEIDWELVVDCMLGGDSGTLEHHYGQTFTNPSSDSAFLWNLLALTYLQAGNLRTYEEMAGSSPAPGGQVPAQLKTALESRGLQRALDAFSRGEWLSYTALSTEELGPVEDLSEFRQIEWKQAMQNGFAMIDLGRLHEAGRSFQTAASSSSDQILRLLSLNALCLTFFKLGDYTQSEILFKEFENLRDAQVSGIDTPEMQDYRKWLAGVGVEAEIDDTYFNPFTLMSGSQTGSSETEETDFWKSLSEALSQISDGRHGEAKRILQSLEQNAALSGQETQKYLVVLAYLCSAVKAGDHFEVQDFEQELTQLQYSVRFSTEDLEEGKETFAWSGFDAVSLIFARFEGGVPCPINAWQDLAG